MRVPPICKVQWYSIERTTNRDSSTAISISDTSTQSSFLRISPNLFFFSRSALFLTSSMPCSARTDWNKKSESNGLPYIILVRQQKTALCGRMLHSGCWAAEWSTEAAHSLKYSNHLLQTSCWEKIFSYLYKVLKAKRKTNCRRTSL